MDSGCGSDVGDVGFDVHNQLLNSWCTAPPSAEELAAIHNCLPDWEPDLNAREIGWLPRAQEVEKPQHEIFTPPSGISESVDQVVCPFCEASTGSVKEGSSPPLIRGSGEEPRRNAPRPKVRKYNPTGRWSARMGYNGPAYCKGCSEIFRSHLLHATHVTRNGCTRATPCVHCVRILSHFDRPPAAVFREWDAARQARGAKAQSGGTRKRVGGSEVAAIPTAVAIATACPDATDSNRSGTPRASASWAVNQAKRARYAPVAVVGTLVVFAALVNLLYGHTKETVSVGTKGDTPTSDYAEQQPGNHSSAMASWQEGQATVGAFDEQDASIEAFNRLRGEIRAKVLFCLASFVVIGCLFCRCSCRDRPLLTDDDNDDDKTSTVVVKPAAPRPPTRTKTHKFGSSVNDSDGDEGQKAPPIETAENEGLDLVVQGSWILCECGLIPWAWTIIFFCTVASVMATTALTVIVFEPLLKGETARDRAMDLVQLHTSLVGLLFAMLISLKIVFYIGIPIFLVRFRRLQGRRTLWVLWLAGNLLVWIGQVICDLQGRSPSLSQRTGPWIGNNWASCGNDIFVAENLMMQSIFISTGVMTFRAMRKAKRDAREWRQLQRGKQPRAATAQLWVEEVYSVWRPVVQSRSCAANEGRLPLLLNL